MSFFNTAERIVALQAAADSWLGTPFFPHGRAKGPRGGCSCQSLVWCIYEEVGVMPACLCIPEGPLDWGHAQKESLIEKFVDEDLWTYFDKASAPALCGDLLGFRAGGCVHHLGLCLGERFVHCLKPYGVLISHMQDATYLSRLERVWRPR